jgi:hypothetical protein
LAKKAQCDLYRLERFSPERLARLPHELVTYAEAINGLPKHMANRSTSAAGCFLFYLPTMICFCVGCAAMLLPASNYFLRGYGQEISGIAVKLCTLQMYFYAPWYARPGEVSGFDIAQPAIYWCLIHEKGLQKTKDSGHFNFDLKGAKSK